MIHSSNTSTTSHQVMSAIQIKDFMMENFNPYDGNLFSDEINTFLLMNGALCWIPDETTLANLFTSWNIITKDPALILNALKTDIITSGAKILKGDVNDSTYLVTNGTKMLILSPNLMNKFGFVQPTTIPQFVIELIPEGVNVN